MLRFALDAITGFSIGPLRAASYMGFLFGIGGVATMIYAIHSWFTSNSVTGWTSLIMVVLLLGSTQLFVLGIIGEYLGRLYMETKRRPLFVIETIYSLQAKSMARRSTAEAARLVL
jgi:polyisoprenyl-phosphate glycosyltransferase